MRTKKYSKTSQYYECLIKRKGYFVKYNWTTQYGDEYEDVTIRGPKFRGYGTEYPTMRKAWEAIR